MMLSNLVRALRQSPDAPLRLELPDGGAVPAHFHVTEAGRTRKDFIDCGGTARSLSRCVLQVWVAGDLDHRVTAGKLAKIIGLAAPILGDGDLEVEVEYDVGVITQMPVVAMQATEAGIVLRLAPRHTACLAPDRCGVPDSTCAAPGCCPPAVESPVPLSLGGRK